MAAGVMACAGVVTCVVGAPVGVIGGGLAVAGETVRSTATGNAADQWSRVLNNESNESSGGAKPPTGQGGSSGQCSSCPNVPDVPAGVENLTGDVQMATNDALDTAVEFLGPGYRDMGGGRFLGTDGLRQVRMTNRDLAHPVQQPHINFETYANPTGPGIRAGKPTSNIYVYTPERTWMAPPVTDDSSKPKRIPICVDVIEYAPSRGLISDWDDETVLRVEMLDSPPNTVLISGNRAGLTSLARHLLTLTQAKAQRGAHLDFDDYSGWFEEGSAGVRIELE